MSTSAIIYNGKKLTKDQNEKALLWNTYRGQVSSIRRSWIKALSDYNSLESTMRDVPDTTYQTASQSLATSSKAYLEVLEKMKSEHGIWNCMEYAHYAAIMIHQKKMLASGFKAEVVSLNNWTIPDPILFYEMGTGTATLKLSQEEMRSIKAELSKMNHDHAFVRIIRTLDTGVSKKAERFIVDLWQYPANGKAFIGTEDWYLTNLTPDEVYVKKGVRREHFCSVIASGGPAAATGESEPIKGFSEFDKESDVYGSVGGKIPSL